MIQKVRIPAGPQDDKEGLSINPMLFREEGINVVPTVVIRHRGKEERKGEGKKEGKEKWEKEWKKEVIRGDISLFSILELIQYRETTNSQSLYKAIERLKKRLRRGFYE